MFSALGPYLIDWYEFTPGQVMFLAAMEPLGAMVLSIPMGIVSDRYGGRTVFTVLLLVLALALITGLFVESYLGFLLLGTMLGLGGASFVVGNAHVSAWYPKARQGTALGILALGNVGIVLGLVLVPLLVSDFFGGPVGYDALPARYALGPVEGWRLIFLIFAAPAILMAVLYWTLTADPPRRRTEASFRQIARVFRSSRLVWIIAYLYWTSFGTLTFFAASTPVYLTDRWGVDEDAAAMIFTSLLVVCVAVTRPIGGWLSDRRDPHGLLTLLFLCAVVFATALTLEVSLTVQVVATYALALVSGAAAACVVKLIPTYFDEVGAVSGLAKAAGAACGFTMTSIMALSSQALGSYVPGFVIWAAMNALALYLAASRAGVPATSATAVPQAAFHREDR
ncbi:MAG: MFS transporter [Thermoleophilia bacterium]|nr:MFS transporter [Thermoleophilia bacterium]